MTSETPAGTIGQAETGGGAPAADRKPRMKTYREQVLEIDPGATLKGGPRMLGGRSYDMFYVVDSDGVEIGYTDGNEQGDGWAWMRALGALRARQRREAGRP